MYPTPTPTTLGADGEDPCIIDVTDAAIDGVTVLICLCGLVENGAVLWLLGFRSLKNTIIAYIRILSIIDFIFLLFIVTSSFLYTIENVFCITVGFLKYLRRIFVLPMYSYSLSFYVLTAMSIERSMSILHLSPSSRCTQPYSRISVLFCLLSTMIYSAVGTVCSLGMPIDCQIAHITMTALTLLICVPLMVICTTFLLIKVLCGSQEHQPRRLYIVVFVSVLFFLLFGFPLSICNFLQQLGHHLLSSKIALLLACIKSSINPFIYFFVGTWQRPCSCVSPLIAFRRVFEQSEYNLADRNDNDTVMDTLNPVSAQLNRHGTITEGLPE